MIYLKAINLIYYIPISEKCKENNFCYVQPIQEMSRHNNSGLNFNGFWVKNSKHKYTEYFHHYQIKSPVSVN